MFKLLKEELKLKVTIEQVKKLNNKNLRQIFNTYRKGIEGLVYINSDKFMNACLKRWDFGDVRAFLRRVQHGGYNPDHSYVVTDLECNLYSSNNVIDLIVIDEDFMKYINDNISQYAEMFNSYSTETIKGIANSELKVLFNQYCCQTNNRNKIININDNAFLIEVMSDDNSFMSLAKKISLGRYNAGDNYARLNNQGNLVSSNFVYDLIDEDKKDFIDWLNSNYEYCYNDCYIGGN